MTDRQSRRMFLTAVAVLIVLPLVQMMFGVFRIGALNEKRTRYEIQNLWPRLQGGDGMLAADVSKWFDDHYGFRDLLIRLKNQFDYSVFGTSHRISMGKNGWLFFRDHDY